MTDRKLVLMHWPNTIAFRYPDSNFVISLDPHIDAAAWDIFDFSETDEDAAWAMAAEYTRGLLLRSANLQEEIAKCEEVRDKSIEPDGEIFARIIERLRGALANTDKKMPALASPAFHEVYALAVKVFGDESAAALWLCQRTDQPGGRSALQVLQAEDGAETVKGMLQSTGGDDGA